MTNINGSLRLGQILAPGRATMAWNANTSTRERMVRIMGGGLRFPKRMEANFDAVRTKNWMAKAESRRIMVLRV